jgi:hypothetical protein
VRPMTNFPPLSLRNSSDPIGPGKLRQQRITKCKKKKYSLHFIFRLENCFKNNKKKLKNYKKQKDRTMGFRDNFFSITETEEKINEKNFECFSLGLVSN